MIGNIFDIFSKRKVHNQKKIVPLTPEFRNRILMMLRDSMGNEFHDFLEHLQKKLAYLHGTPILSGHQGGVVNPVKDVISFLNGCDDAHFLDAIEYAFQLDNGRFTRLSEKLIIRQVNEFLKIDHLPYYLTESVWEETEVSFHGTITMGNQLREHPHPR